ncbi:hypothetical protein HY085_00490 [Candidatus Gottesmanbacteria bacterium]|nr:hypothetical protein [Candidatus Gottesmanbacteria bacterium]
MSTLITGGNLETRLAEAKKMAPEALEFDVSTVEEIRDLQKVTATGQAVIIKNAQNLTVAAQNAFLKTLEEGSANIILLAPNEDALLPTVVSRCFIFSKKVLPYKGETLKGETFTREEALNYIDSLILKKPYAILRKLLQAKKYLKTNVNVRLTLENLPLN